MPLVRKMFQSVVNLLSLHDPVFNVRTRVLTADINAGYTVLPAVRGYKYRVVDMMLIAVGGVTAGLTDARILATQSGASVALMTSLLAGLGRSVPAYPGVANTSVLADGASFVANDVETAITVGKTGGNLTGATAIDVFISYTLERA